MDQHLKVLESHAEKPCNFCFPTMTTCLSCVRSGNYELQRLCKELSVTDEDCTMVSASVIDDSAVT